MPWIESTQFPRLSYEAWLNSNGPIADEKNPTSKERGMAMFTHLLADEKGKKLIEEYGGYLNIKTVRVMHDKARPEGEQWTLDFQLYKSLKDVQFERAEVARKKAAEEFQKQLAEAKAKQDKEREEQRLAREKKAAAKKQREERLRALGKRPFQKKGAKPSSHSGSKQHPAQ